MVEAAPATCSIEGCDSPARQYGWCYKHYSRWYRHGDPLATKMPTRGLTVAERLLHYSVQGATENDCWRWTGSRHVFGYGILWDVERQRPESAHRLTWEVHFGAIPQGLEVCHTCDNPECCNPKHLFLGTQLDNMHDMDAKGRRSNANRATGERAGSARLTTDNVQEIRQRSQRGATQRTLAADYGVGKSTIARVLRGETWRHVA